MAIKSIHLENEKAVRLAHADNLPMVMIIAGPNGVGKSTLMNCLRKRKGVQGLEGKIVYLGPHRIKRRIKISRKSLYGFSERVADIFGAATLPISGEVRYAAPSRDPTDVDEAPTVVKRQLASINERWRDSIADKVEKNAFQYPAGSAPDPLEPLRRIVSFFLPYLGFVKIDQTKADNIRVLFRHVDAGDNSPQLDLDDLSSGEREIVTLLLPLIDEEVESILRGDSSNKEMGGYRPLVVLIDEPELHLHGALLERLLNYCREQAREKKHQFIFSTHSPLLVEAATSDELYTLKYASHGSAANQLVQVATEQEKLELIRALGFPSLYLTTCRPALILEGVSPENAGIATDVEIFNLMRPDLATRIDVVPIGGRNLLRGLAESAIDALKSMMKGRRFLLVVDRDLELISETEHLKQWPVRCIENLLLRPKEILEAIKPYSAKVPLTDEGQVRQSLKTIAQNLTSKEVKIRAFRELGKAPLKIDAGSAEDFSRSLQESLEGLRVWHADRAEVEQLFAEVNKQVSEILEKGRELEEFDGKEMMRAFHEGYIKSKGIGVRFREFVLQVAREVGRSGTRDERIDALLSDLLRT